MKTDRIRWTLLISANALLWCMLSFYQTSRAAPQASRQPFANAVEQRNEIIRQLKEINTQLKQQNLLLQSGKVKVVLGEKNKH